MKITNVKVTHFGEDYAKIEVFGLDANAHKVSTEYEVAYGVGTAIKWLEHKNAEQAREIKRLINL